MTILFVLCSVCTALFTLTCVSFSGGVPLVGFLVTFLYSLVFYFVVFRFVHSPSRKKLTVVKKLLEYLVFVLFAALVARRAGISETGFLLDLASVSLWLVITVTIAILLFRLSDKRVHRYYPSLEKPVSGKKPIIVHAFEWIDALIQAACLVLLINLFFFQLYEIPSESMVPEFMVKDRVVVVKTVSGPKFPLTQVGIPRMRTYERGDIVVFSNPHYNDTREARLRSFVSQLVYMLSFTTVNINRDESGAVKADPLVKRVVGLPGEKLMMVDGVLYSKQENDDEYLPVQEEARWAAWDIASLPRSQLSLVRNVPLSREAYDLLLSVESLRAELNTDAALTELIQIAKRFENLKPVADSVGFDPDLVSQEEREILSLFQANDTISRVLLTTNGGAAWFRSFLTAWSQSESPKNLFETRSQNCNLLLKIAFGKLVVRNAELMTANVTASEFVRDTQRRALLSEADTYRFFMAVHDQRNMAEFPPDQSIPENAFLLMGDNRLNSLDMRHSYTVTLVPVDIQDPLSFLYHSNLDPQWVPSERIMGTALFRFWPPARAGVPH
ncbi:MAG TPA: signal peptidase I [Treponema sp.]|nr:signal peptidase I [Treponema sp.]